MSLINHLAYFQVQRLVYVDVLESKVVEAQSIPLHLDRLSQLESLIAEARSWSERTAKTFLKKHSTLSLIEVTVIMCRPSTKPCRCRLSLCNNLLMILILFLTLRSQNIYTLLPGTRMSM